jgi:hypothetical protein
MRILRANQRKSGPERSKKQRILRNRTEGPGPQRHDETLTNSRLDKRLFFIGDVIRSVARASRPWWRERPAPACGQDAAGKMPAPHHGLTMAFGNLIILLRLIKWSVLGEQGGEGARCSPKP